METMQRRWWLWSKFIPKSKSGKQNWMEYNVQLAVIFKNFVTFILPWNFNHPHFFYLIEAYFLWMPVVVQKPEAPGVNHCQIQSHWWPFRMTGAGFKAGTVVGVNGLLAIVPQTTTLCALIVRSHMINLMSKHLELLTTKFGFITCLRI